MAERFRLAPMMDMLTNEMAMLNDLFEELQKVKGDYYNIPEHQATLRKVYMALSLDTDIKDKKSKGYTPPETPDDFGGIVGKCQREILNRSKQIRKDTMELLKAISREEITIGGEKKQEGADKEEAPTKNFKL